MLNGVSSTQCNCCPYGYHIDLDFVKYAEDISTGKEHIQNWYSDPNAIRTRMTSPNTSSMVDRENRKTDKEKVPNVPVTESYNSAFVSTYGRSFIARSPFSNYPNMSKQLKYVPTSILKNRDNDCDQKAHSVRFATARLHDTDNFISRSSAHASPAHVDFNNKYTKYYNRNRPSTKQVKQSKGEVSIPLSYLGTSYNDENSITKGKTNNYINKSMHCDRIFSAPTSPIPKLFHTAIAQSMAHLKHIPQTPTDQVNANDTDTESATYLNRRNAQHNNHSERHLKSFPENNWSVNENRRPNRILSPEPEITRFADIPSSAMALRAFNLHSRSYFCNNFHDEVVTSPSNKTIYSATPASSIFDFDTFASIQRPKAQLLKPLQNYVKSPRNLQSTTSSHFLQPYDAMPIENTIKDNVKLETNNDHERNKSTTSHNSADKFIQTLVLVRNIGVQTNIDITQNQKSTMTEDIPLLDYSTKNENLLSQPKKTPLNIEFQFCIGHEPEHAQDDIALHTTKSLLSNQYQQTDAAQSVDKFTNTESAKKSIAVQSDRFCYETVASQATVNVVHTCVQTTNATSSKISSEVQTDFAYERAWLDELVRLKQNDLQLEENKILSDISSSIDRDKITQTDNEIDNEFILITYSKCDNSLTPTSICDNELYQKLSDQEAEQCSKDECINSSPLTPDYYNNNVNITEMEKSIDISHGDKKRRHSNPETVTIFDRCAQSKRTSSLRHISAQNAFDSDESITEIVEKTNVTQVGNCKVNEKGFLSDDFSDNPAIPSIRLDILNNDNKELDYEIDRISNDTDVQTIVFPGYNKNLSCSSSSASIVSDSTLHMEETAMSEVGHRPLDPSSTEAIRKLLTEPQKCAIAKSSNMHKNAEHSESSRFCRDALNYRSCRMERAKSSDLDYIADRHINKTDLYGKPSTPSSIAGSAHDTGLKEMVVLKKQSTFSDSTNNSSTITTTVTPFTSHIPYPVNARIPRPKYTSLLISHQVAETPDEQAEADDQLTPLRSEMKSLRSWDNFRHSSGAYDMPSIRGNQIGYNFYNDNNVLHMNDRVTMQENDFGDEVDEELDVTRDSIRPDSSSSADDGAQSDATYDMSESEYSKANAIYFEDDTVQLGALKLSDTLIDALVMLKETLDNAVDSKVINELDYITENAEWAIKFVRHEWLKISTKRSANAQLVDAFLHFLRNQFSFHLMKIIINLTDQNENMALHYAVSHENYEVVSVLLDAKACNVNGMNKAGYSAVMLGALCDITNETESAIIHRLFHVGNVNAKAVKHSQTALMLAASHGRIETTELLLNCGADVNIQDVDGSTALMCAAEHGQKDVVKILLKQPSIDASLTDCDNQTALSIAVENQHRDIGVIIYAHLNFSRLEQNDNSVII